MFRNASILCFCFFRYSYAKEIAANIELISQIEICARGILSRDTKEKSVPFLVDYIQFYSNLAAGVGDDLKKGVYIP